MNKNASSSFANDPWSAVTSDGPSLSSFGGSCRTRCQTANALYRRTHAGRLNEAQAIYRRDLEARPGKDSGYGRESDDGARRAVDFRLL